MPCSVSRWRKRATDMSICRLTWSGAGSKHQSRLVPSGRRPKGSKGNGRNGPNQGVFIPADPATVERISRSPAAVVRCYRLPQGNEPGAMPDGRAEKSLKRPLRQHGAGRLFLYESSPTRKGWQASGRRGRCDGVFNAVTREPGDLPNETGALSRQRSLLPAARRLSWLILQFLPIRVLFRIVLSRAALRCCSARFSCSAPASRSPRRCTIRRTTFATPPAFPATKRGFQ